MLFYYIFQHELSVDIYKSQLIQVNCMFLYHITRLTSLAKSKGKNTHLAFHMIKREINDKGKEGAYTDG